MKLWMIVDSGDLTQNECIGVVFFYTKARPAGVQYHSKCSLSEEHLSRTMI